MGAFLTWPVTLHGVQLLEQFSSFLKSGPQYFTLKGATVQVSPHTPPRAQTGEGPPHLLASSSSHMMLRRAQKSRGAVLFHATDVLSTCCVPAAFPGESSLGSTQGTLPAKLPTSCNSRSPVGL